MSFISIPGTNNIDGKKHGKSFESLFFLMAFTVIFSVFSLSGVEIFASSRTGTCIVRKFDNNYLALDNSRELMKGSFKTDEAVQSTMIWTFQAGYLYVAEELMEAATREELPGISELYATKQSTARTFTEELLKEREEAYFEGRSYTNYFPEAAAIFLAIDDPDIADEFIEEDENALTLADLSAEIAPVSLEVKELNYVVRPGDSLYSIASKFNISLKQLKTVNGIVNPVVQPGQILVIPLNPDDMTIRLKTSMITSTLERQTEKPGRLVLKTSLSKIRKIPQARRMSKYYSEESKHEFKGGRFLCPMKFVKLTSGYGYRIHPIYRKRRFHEGIDLAASYGTPIVAAESGKVIFSGWRGAYGRTVMIKHDNGLVTLYAHASKLLVSEGQRVTRGQKIAQCGRSGLSTGPHLHFEVRKGSETINPMKFLK